MMKNKFYKYVFVVDSNEGTFLDVVENSEFYYNATNKDTVRFFKSFGKCYFRHNSNHDVFYTSCNNNYKIYRYYNSLSELIKNEGLSLIPLSTGKNTREKSFYNKAWIITDKKGLNKGLMSYDELVASFHAGNYIKLFGYFSQTTTRHQDAYIFPSIVNYRFKGNTEKITKKVLENKSCFYFDMEG